MYRGVLNKAEVAIKVVSSHDRDQQAKFVQEIVTLRACHNTHIVQVPSVVVPPPLRLRCGTPGGCVKRGMQAASVTPAACAVPGGVHPGPADLHGHGVHGQRRPLHPARLRRKRPARLVQAVSPRSSSSADRLADRPALQCWCVAGSLAHRAPLGACRGQKIALDVCLGLCYLHSKHIAHLDLKSPNVLLNSNFQAKIGDVGLGKIISARQAAATRQGEQSAAGSLHACRPQPLHEPAADAL